MRLDNPANVISIVVKPVPFAGPGRKMQCEITTGAFSGSVTIWYAAEHTSSLGRGLLGFPNQVPDRYEYYFEGEPENLCIRARTADRAGHCILEVGLFAPGATCEFSALTEAAAISRLGTLFVGLGGDDTSGFSWTSSPSSGSHTAREDTV
jgi:hypothetical protein